MTCPCEKYSACVPGCALMDYPGYMVSFESNLSERRAQQQQPRDIFPRTLGSEEWIKQQIEAEDDGFRTAYPEMPYSPELPDVTRATIQDIVTPDPQPVWPGDPAPVSELVQEIDEWYADNDPLMAGAGDGNSPPWTENKFIDTPEKRASFVEGVRRGGDIADAEHQTMLDGILEQRGSRYGAFRDNADISQTLKETIHHHPMSNWETLASDQREALDQFACKISRLLVGDPDYVDNWDDIAGYAKLVADRLREDQAS